jgi:hypothetical protein
MIATAILRAYPDAGRGLRRQRRRPNAAARAAMSEGMRRYWQRRKAKKN